MQNHNAEIFTNAGFKTPPITYRKTDPRGAEYGYHQVEHDEDGPHEGDIRVTKHDGEGTAQYSFLFTSAVDFSRWAKDNS